MPLWARERRERCKSCHREGSSHSCATCCAVLPSRPYTCGVSECHVPGKTRSARPLTQKAYLPQSSRGRGWDPLEESVFGWAFGFASVCCSRVEGEASGDGSGDRLLSADSAAFCCCQAAPLSAGSGLQVPSLLEECWPWGCLCPLLRLVAWEITLPFGRS